MKRFWHTWMALVATAMMVGSANAQEIGSYQSILARAGYTQGAAHQGAVSIANPAQMSVPSPPGAGCNTGCGAQGGGAYGGGAYGGGANVYGGSYGGAVSGGSFNGGNAYGGSSYGGMYNRGSAYGGGQMNGGMVGGQMNGGMVGGQMNGGMVGGQMNGGMVGGQMNGGMVGGQMNGGMVGGQMNGGMAVGATSGGVVNGGMVGGGQVNGTVVDGGSTGGMVGGQMNGGMVTNGAMMNGGAVYGGNMGYVGGPVVSAPSYGTNYVDYGTSNYVAAPVYVPGNAGVRTRLAGMGKRGNNNNMVLGIFGVVLRRDYEDSVLLAYDGGNNGIFTTGVDHGRMSGLGVSLASRNCSGGGWEMSYWGLDEEDDRSYFGPITSNLNGLTAVTIGANDVYTIFNNADNVRVYRDTDIHNFEINMLRNGGQYRTHTGKSANFELTGGIRFFKFDESLRYVSNSFNAAYPYTTEYNLEAENTLVGLQVGGRSEICLSNRLRMNYGGQFGLYNNNINTRQRVFDDTGAYGQVNTGGGARDFDYTDTKNDAAMLGQFDLGLIYQVSQSARVRVGYRALGVAGVALAADQIPYQFDNALRNSTAQSNGNLLLHGLYFGSEFCF